MVRTKGWLVFIYKELTAILFTLLLWRGFISVEVRNLCLNWICQEGKILNQARYVNLFSLGNCHWSLNEGKITFPQTSKWSLLIQHANKSLIHGCTYCLYASLFLSVGPIYFYAEPYLICQGIQWPYREGSWLPSAVFHLGGPSYPSLGRVCAAELFPWENIMDLLWNIWGLPRLPCNQGTCPLGGLADVWRVVHTGIGQNSLVSSPLQSRRGSKGHPSSIVLVFKETAKLRKNRDYQEGLPGLSFLTRVENTGACRPYW